MAATYKEVKKAIEAAQEETIDQSFIDSNRFEDNKARYSQCKYKFGKINYKNARSLCIGICCEDDMLIEIYEIKNYKNKVEVLAYSAANKESSIRFIPDALVITSSISRFFDGLITFLRSAKEHRLDNKTILKEINEGQDIQLDINELKELKMLYSEVERCSIFNPCKNCFVAEKHAANYIEKQQLCRYAVLRSTEIAAGWRMPLVYDKNSLEIIASVNISRGMSDRLCTWIANDIAAFLERQGIKSSN